MNQRKSYKMVYNPRLGCVRGEDTSLWDRDSEEVFYTEEQPLRVKIYKCHPDAKIPVRATPESAAWDIHTIDNDIIFYPGNVKVLRTGLIIQPPSGYHFKMYPRSGWGRKYEVGIPHS